MIEFASRYDPQWFHIDPVRAREGRWKGLIASGGHTCAIAMELMVRNVLSESESFGSPGIESLKWLHPVRPDDKVALHLELLVFTTATFELAVALNKKTSDIQITGQTRHIDTRICDKI